MPQAEKTGRIMLYLSWFGVLALLTWVFGVWEEDRQQRWSGNINSNPLTEQENGLKTVHLEANGAGHYLSSGKINKHEVTFLLDTGATLVSVPEAVARKAGMKKGPASYSQTANGRVRSYYSRIETLQLGNITLHNVQASINTGSQGEEILLGMSALGQLTFQQQGKRLSLVQHSSSP